MSHEHRELQELSVRVGKLEGQVRMLSQIADFEKHPFLFSILESDLSIEQKDAIMKLACRVQDTLKSAKPMNHVQFENELYKIAPSENGNYEFAKTIVMTLHDEGLFVDVYNHFKKDGMNI